LNILLYRFGFASLIGEVSPPNLPFTVSIRDILYKYILY